MVDPDRVVPERSSRNDRPGMSFHLSEIDERFDLSLGFFEHGGDCPQELEGDSPQRQRKSVRCGQPIGRQGESFIDQCAAEVPQSEPVVALRFLPGVDRAG